MLDIKSVGILIKTIWKETFWSTYCTLGTILYRIHVIVHQEICIWSFRDPLQILLLVLNEFKLINFCSF